MFLDYGMSVCLLNLLKLIDYVIVSKLHNLVVFLFSSFGFLTAKKIGNFLLEFAAVRLFNSSVLISSVERMSSLLFFFSTFQFSFALLLNIQ